MSKKRITLGVVILAIIGLFLFWPSSQSTRNQSASSIGQVNYPAAWSNLRLPTMPGADLTDVNGSDLDEGIEFEFEVNKPANEVGNYYEEQFEDRDFESSGPDESDEENYVNDFSGGDLGINVDVRPDPSNKGRSKVRIWIEKERRKSFKTRNASISVN